jgi:hypothetical protein
MPITCRKINRTINNAGEITGNGVGPNGSHAIRLEPDLMLLFAHFLSSSSSSCAPTFRVVQ